MIILCVNLLKFIGGGKVKTSKLNDFYLRYYTGHKGKYGHEFLEFEFQKDGQLRYANNSNYKSDLLIRKEVYVNEIVLDELIRIVEDSDIFDHEDKIQSWPQPDKIGKQELEIMINDKHISICTTKFGSFLDIEKSEDPDGLRVLYYLLQDIKCFVFSLLNLRFRIKPF